MKYLSSESQIETTINQLSQAKSLWLDTEIADCRTRQPRLSIIQILANPLDDKGKDAIILDVLHKDSLIKLFIEKIMKDANIKKIFHNADFDLRYLGGKNNAQNITCTYRLAQKIGKNTLRTSNLKLKTLAAELCNFHIVEAQGASDWAQRPLSHQQIEYAKMDVVYLAHVHRRLLEFIPSVDPSEKILFSEMPKENTLFPNPPLTLAQIRAASHCPRLFYLSSHYGGESRLHTDSNQIETLVSKCFHHIIHSPFLLPLLEPPFEQLTPETLVKPLLDELYASVFFPYIQQSIQNSPNTVAQLKLTWQSLTRQITRWVDILISNRLFYQPSNLIRQTFILLEDLSLQSLGEQPIHGSFPPILYNHKSQELILLQSQSVLFPDIAIACYLLQQQFNLPLKGISLWVLPKLSTITYPWQNICEIVHQSQNQFPQLHQWLGWQPSQPNPLPPVVEHCSVCPQFQPCQQVFAPPTPTQPTPTTPLPPETSLGKRLVTILNAFGLDVEFVDQIIAPAFIRVKLKPELGVKVTSIINRSEDLQVHLECGCAPLIEPQAGYVSVDIPRKDRQFIDFNQYYPKQTHLPPEPLKIAIGINLEGQLLEVDLSDANTCHFLIGGTTGSGKSEFLRSLLMSMLIQYSPQWLKIILVDPKRVTFPEFESSPWLYQPIIKDDNDAIVVMEELVEEMEKRYRIFEKTRVTNIQQYNQSQSSHLPRLVCIVDEYADLMVEKTTRTALEQNIKRLGAKARASGIHLIIATQRPDAKVVTPIIRSNLPGRIALKTASGVDSRIILGDNYSQAAQLLGKGDLLFPYQSKLERLQALFWECQ